MKTVILDSLLRLFEIEREKLFFLQRNTLPSMEESLRISALEAENLIEESIQNIRVISKQNNGLSKSELIDLLNRTHLKVYRIAYELILDDSSKMDKCSALEKLEYAKKGFEILVFSL
jgi:hypothetical protein